MDLVSLENRVLMLERQNVLFRCLLCTFLLTQAFLSCGARIDGSDTVVAQSFVLEDETGRVRGEWAPSEELLPSEDGAGTPASITCFRLRDSAGGLAFQACGRWDANTSSSVLLSDPTGARVFLNTGTEGASLRVGHQRTSDRPRPPRVGLSADEETASVFVTTGGPRSAILTLDELIMRDERGHVFVRLPVRESNRE